VGKTRAAASSRFAHRSGTGRQDFFNTLVRLLGSSSNLIYRHTPSRPRLPLHSVKRGEVKSVVV
jgi:hypothetical protein